MMGLKKYILAAIMFLLVIGCSKDLQTTVQDLPFLGTVEESIDIYGIVSDTDGNRIEGVVVSDGYTCTATNSLGEYQLKSCEFTYYVFISLPEAYEVPIDDGIPCFYQTFEEGKARYDFTLTPLPGGVETKFKLFCIADPQTESTEQIDRFLNETAIDINEMVDESTLPCYGVALGDINWNYKTDHTTLFPRMKKAIGIQNTGLPIFSVMGNHDNSLLTGSYSVAHDIDAERSFEKVFGPVNYSFNRGNVHIICMDDIVFTTQTSYQLGFRDDQVEWLRQDLSYVSTDKLLIFCVHIPLIARTSYQNVSTVFNILDNFSGYYHIMSGHVHTQTNYEYASHYEHNHGAACGGWWSSLICPDGTPNGYAIYDLDGNDFTNWFYKGTGLDKDFQIRLYKGSLPFMVGYTPFYRFNYDGDNDINANIWSADSGWTVEVYENGSYSGVMEKYSGRDAWASGYLLGVYGKSEGTDYDKSSVPHLYHYTLKDPDAEVEVRATDQFGNVYTQSTFTSNLEKDFPAYE